MQSFWFFVPTKELGVRGLVPANKKLKNIFYRIFLFNFFPPQKVAKSASYLDLYFRIYVKCMVIPQL